MTTVPVEATPIMALMRSYRVTHSVNRNVGMPYRFLMQIDRP